MPVDNKDVKPILVELVESDQTNIQKVTEVVEIKKETVSKGNKYEIEYTNSSQ